MPAFWLVFRPDVFAKLRMIIIFIFGLKLRIVLKFNDQAV